MQILNLHPEINLMQEPFNEERRKWAEDNKNYKHETKTVEDLDRVLEEIHELYNGFKHLSYQLPEDLTKHLIVKKGYKIIFLHRKNYLKSIVSLLVAEQTGVWTPEDKEQKGESKSLKPLNIEEIKEEIEHLKNDLDSYRLMAKKAQIPLLEVTYEDLFTESDDARINKAEEIFAFLGLELPNDKREEVEKLLSPKRKIIGDETYDLVPNIREVERKFGSEENGFLFK